MTGSVGTRSDWIPVAGIWTYAAIVALSIVMHWFPAHLEESITLWALILTQSAAILLLWQMLKSLPMGGRRRAWQVVAASMIFDLSTNLIWNYLTLSSNVTPPGMADALTLGYFPIAIAAGVLFYRDLGGTFRKWSVWLDVLTLTLGFGATLWLFFLRPQLPHIEAGTGNIFISIGYMSGSCLLMVTAGLIAMRIVNWRSERALLTLLLGVSVAFIFDMGWMSSDSREDFASGPWFNIAGTCIPYSFIATADFLERRRDSSLAREPGSPGGRLNFLPVLSVMLAIAMLFGEKANLHGLRAGALVAFVIFGTTLIALRQRGVRYQIHGLQRALALQGAELRLSELVRRSSDLIALVDPLRRLTYVSPACLAMLGVEPQVLTDQPAARLLGAENEQRLQAFLSDIAERRAADGEMDAICTGPDGVRRTYHVTAIDQASNPAIGGIVLTVRDMTEQRRLEREILDLASRARERMATDLHDGLGQELTGISLLLKSMDPQRDRQRGTISDSLQVIESHVDNTIELTRRLSNGLPPDLHRRESLDVVIARFAEQAAERFSFQVSCRNRYTRPVATAADAEHLYRIVQESLHNAARHGECRNVEIELISDTGGLSLTITDDGTGWRGASGAGDGLGLRMIAYRVRMMGGTLQIGATAAGGMRVAVMIPLPPASESQQVPA